MGEACSDEQLVRAARRDDRDAFACLIERHYTLLVASCRRIVGDHELARDAAQEAVIRALLGLDRLRDDSRFGSWLIGIGLNVSRGMRAPGRVTTSLDAAGPEPAPARWRAPGRDPVEIVLRSELSREVIAALAALPAGQRQAAALFYLVGLTHAEIAEELDTRPGAVKTRLYKARTSLRASLTDVYEESIQMSDETTLIPMHVAELRRTAAPPASTERHVMFLRDDGDRRLPIWIGAAEATAMALVLEDVQLPRPGVYQFAAALLAGAGAQLREVRVTKLSASTFYATSVLSDGTCIDARPSDAITLALVTGAPIYVEERVLDQADRQRSELSDLIEEAEAATDDAAVIAAELTARYAAAQSDLAARATPRSSG